MSVYKELKTEPHLSTNRELLKEKLYRDTMLINYLTVSKSFIKERIDQKHFVIRIMMMMLNVDGGMVLKC